MFSRVYLLFIVTVLTNFNFIESIKVCKHTIDYYIPFSKNCETSPYTNLNVTEIIQTYGFNVKEYTITTEDGYELLLIKVNSNNSTIKRQKNPIILGHGIFSNCIVYTNRGEKSYIYQFVQGGYEIWLLNFRGTVYSRNIYYSVDEQSFWKFSFHEMGVHDLRSIVNFVYEKTKQKSVYVGYSMGTSAGFVYSSIFAEEAAQKLIGMVSLAPIAYMDYVKSFFIKYGTTILPILKPFIMFFTHGEIVQQPGIIKFLCARYPVTMMVCNLAQNLVVGIQSDQSDPAYAPLVYSMNVDNLGLKVLEHYVQDLTSVSFRQFDYGRNDNLLKYGREIPPKYVLSNISIPVSLMVGADDWIATVRDSKKIYNNLKPEKQCGFEIVKHARFNHVDFLEAIDIVPLVLKPTLKVISAMTNEQCEKYNKDNNNINLPLK